MNIAKYIDGKVSAAVALLIMVVACGSLLMYQDGTSSVWYFSVPIIVILSIVAGIGLSKRSES